MSQPATTSTHTHTHPSSLPPTSTRNSKLWEFVTERCFSRSAFLGFDHIGSSTPHPSPRSKLLSARAHHHYHHHRHHHHLSLFLSFCLSLSLVGSPCRNIFVCFLTIKVFFSLSASLLLYCDTFCLFLLTGRLCCRYSCKSQTHTVRYIIRKANKRETRQKEKKTKPEKHTFLCSSSHIPSASASVQPSLSYANQACSSFPAFPPSPLPPPRPLLLRPDATSCCNAPRKMPKVCAVSHL